jgi:hypothetical protein
MNKDIPENENIRIKETKINENILISITIYANNLIINDIFSTPLHKERDLVPNKNKEIDMHP